MFPIEDAKTGKNIRREVIRLLVNKFGLDPSLHRIVWVIDEGSNIIKALAIAYIGGFLVFITLLSFAYACASWPRSWDALSGDNAR